jgi:hypothetical protein
LKSRLYFKYFIYYITNNSSKLLCHRNISLHSFTFLQVEFHKTCCRKLRVILCSLHKSNGYHFLRNHSMCDGWFSRKQNFNFLFFQIRREMQAGSISIKIPRISTSKVITHLYYLFTSSTKNTFFFKITINFPICISSVLTHGVDFSFQSEWKFKRELLLCSYSR